MKRSARLLQPLAMRTDRYIGMGTATVDGDDAWRLIAACVDGDIDVVESLLDRDPSLVNVQYWYEMPITFALREGQVEVVRVLLQRGADPTTACYGADVWGEMLEVAELRGLDAMADLLRAEMIRRFDYSPGFERLAAAIRAYDSVEIGRLLDARPTSIEGSDGSGNGVVHWAAMTHQPELIDALRERGADVDRERADGRSPLLVTVHGDYRFRGWRDVPEDKRREPGEIIAALLDAGAVRPLSMAILGGEHDVVERQLAAQPELADTLDRGRTSPLCYASFGRQPRMTELLLAHGADPNRPEALAPRGRALFEASARNEIEQARMLLDAGADPNAQVDSSGNCLWIVASRDPDNADAMQQLLTEHGARQASWQMDAQELRAVVQSGESLPDDSTLWTDVLQSGDMELLDLLIERNPEVPPLLGGWVFRTSSGELVATPENLARLIDAGLDIARGDWQGATPLHYCAQFGALELATDLLDRGVPVDALELTHGGTPLATAARHGQLELVELLLARGADAHAPARSAWAQPLAEAKRAGHTAITDRLGASESG